MKGYKYSMRASTIEGKTKRTDDNQKVAFSEVEWEGGGGLGGGGLGGGGWFIKGSYRCCWFIEKMFIYYNKIKPIWIA